MRSANGADETIGCKISAFAQRAALLTGLVLLYYFTHLQLQLHGENPEGFLPENYTQGARNCTGMRSLLVGVEAAAFSVSFQTVLSFRPSELSSNPCQRGCFSAHLCCF